MKRQLILAKFLQTAAFRKSFPWISSLFGGTQLLRRGGETFSGPSVGSEQVCTELVSCICHRWLWQVQILCEGKLGKQIISKPYFPFLLASSSTRLSLNCLQNLENTFFGKSWLRTHRWEAHAALQPHKCSITSSVRLSSSWARLTAPFDRTRLQTSNQTGSPLLLFFPNWILKWKQPHYLLRVRKLLPATVDLQLSCLITFGHVNSYLQMGNHYYLKTWALHLLHLILWTKACYTLLQTIARNLKLLQGQRSTPQALYHCLHTRGSFSQRSLKRGHNLHSTLVKVLNQHRADIGLYAPANRWKGQRS